MVVGAGRGPLVKCALNAAEKTSRKMKVFAVEKNPNAINTFTFDIYLFIYTSFRLRCRKRDENWTNVTIVDSDMRVWNAPEKADILVSELLGSFGDNELSPECLDGAQKFLKGSSFWKFFLNIRRGRN